MLSSVVWNADPAIFSLGPLEIRWYGLLFAIGFLVGYYIEAKIFKNDKAPDDWCDKLFVYVIVATIIGARLGHCFFYDWDYYTSNPIEIFKIWEGGLASHGGTIAIIIAVLIYAKKVTHRNALWVFDRLVIPIALVASMIRFGNLMNHEIYGTQTTMPWGFNFITNISEWQNGAAPQYSPTSHPTQIYEALSYFALFVTLMFMYWKRGAGDKRGLLFGVFFLWVFGSRFAIEFLKLPQEMFEIELMERVGMNMGQILSIPFIIIGIYFTIIGLNATRKSGKISHRHSHIHRHYKK
ncbi:MAG: prolipoprotein diacylglyceryl transferase [Bacteroidales bacterium]|nr:prolipoprotein diacylglyceryl transferase [Bacteroidales bacterium]